MKARITLDLAVAPIEQAQKFLQLICEGLVQTGSAKDFSFEIDTDQGVVTEKCVLSGDRVIA